MRAPRSCAAPSEQIGQRLSFRPAPRRLCLSPLTQGKRPSAPPEPGRWPVVNSLFVRHRLCGFLIHSSRGLSCVCGCSGGLPWFLPRFRRPLSTSFLSLTNVGTPLAKLAENLNCVCQFVWLECDPKPAPRPFHQSPTAMTRTRGIIMRRSSADFEWFHFYR